MTLDAKGATVASRSVVAQTKTGATDNVIVAGAHLDSAPASPGINDNATGAAAVLETAVQLGSSPQVTNAVRFAFWGGHEAGLAGATKYVQSLGPGGLKDVAMYLDFDRLGSPNAGFFTYDGDQSGQPNPAIPVASVPTGSAGIERTLAGYLNLAGVRPADTPLGGASDYGPFLSAGIPIGGLTTGSTQTKSAVQQRLWGGETGIPFDMNYRSARDGIDNVDRRALSITGPAVAFAVGTYADVHRRRQRGPAAEADRNSYAFRHRGAYRFHSGVCVGLTFVKQRSAPDIGDRGSCRGSDDGRGRAACSRHGAKHRPTTSTTTMTTHRRRPRRNTTAATAQAAAPTVDRDSPQSADSSTVTNTETQTETQTSVATSVETDTSTVTVAPTRQQDQHQQDQRGSGPGSDGQHG